MRSFFAICTLAFALLLPAVVMAEAPKDLRLIRVVPEGQDIRPGRQIVFTFNRPVAPIGKMERTADEIPVTVTPALECEWRWINTSSLTCQLGDKTKMQPSTTYTVEMKPGIAAEDGAQLAEAYTSTFTTERADVRYSWFRTWRGPGTPVIRLTFNQPVTINSVKEAMHFVPTGGKPVAMKVEADPQDDNPPVFVPLPGEGGMFAIFGNQEPRKSDDALTSKDGLEARRIWLVEPVSELPQDTPVALKLSPGLVSAEGPEKSAQDRDVVNFDTYPSFAFLGVKCTDNNDAEVFVKPGEDPLAVGKLCDPLAPISLAFSRPVQRSKIKAHVEFMPALGAASAADDVWGDFANEQSLLNRPHSKDTTYNINLPYGLKAAQTYTVTLPEKKLGFWAKISAWFRSLFGKKDPATVLQDEFASYLPQGFSMVFATDHRRPNFELLHNTAVLEGAIDSEVPLHVNNLKNTTFNFRSLTAAGAKADQKLLKDVPEVQDIQFAVPFDVRGALAGKSGAVYGHLQTEPFVKNKGDSSRRLFAQVTPWQMHVKLGHFSTLVWLTDMATGAPVANVDVTLYRDTLSMLGVPAASNTFGRAKTDSRGLALLPGSAEVDPARLLARGWDDADPKVFVLAQKGDDMAVMPLSYDFTINTWRVSNENIYSSSKKRYGHMVAWGATAQGIYRAGDTIQYKFYVRDQNDRTLVTAPRTGYKLEIVDPMDNIVATIDDLRLNNFGAYGGEFKVPETAPVGFYSFRLTANFAETDEDDYEGISYWQPIRVLVTDFTPAPFRVTTSLNGDLFQNGQDVTVQSGARMHAGGPYTDASARITARLTPRSFSSKHPVAAGFYFDTYTGNDTRQVFQTTGPVDNNGDVTASFKLNEADMYYGRLSVETAVQDDRGKYIAAAASADFVGRDRFVGLRSTKWVHAAKSAADVDFIVVDEKGTPVKEVPVSVSFERQVTVAAKVKGAGNAYLTHYTTTWEPAETCTATSLADAAKCSFVPTQAGSYRAIASIQDTKGLAHQTTMHMWVSGNDYVMWHDESDVLLSIIPEKTEYKVGDTARYLVKNPWPGAEALVTIERYGIIDSFVMKLDGSTPIVEFPVKPDYLPGFYMSVMVTSPRAADAPLEGQVDLGKPAFRMGYVTVPVKDPYKQMDVTVKTAQEIYRPRDKVTVDLTAVPRHTNGIEPVEIAVAVLDEAVFDLIAGGATAYDPYDGFYKLQNLDVQNYNLLTRLIGRQKFEKKGANPGGDGGSDLAMRDLFKFVAYWNPSLRADTQGKAQFTFDVPDNLTGWRVLAMAVTPTDRLGLGQGTFKVNRPTEVRPVMPNQVTERDTFKAGFSVMNRTDKPRVLSVTLSAKGPVDTQKHPAILTETVKLEPYKRTTVYMPVTTTALPETADAMKGEIVFTAKAEDDVDGDGMVYRVPVNKMRSLEMAANYGTTTEDHAVESIAFPDNIYPDIGGISVVLSPSVISAVEGAFKYMRDYAYLCWEQILTKGVMASNYLDLKAYMPDDFKWPQAEKLPQSTLDNAAAFQAPNGGMTYFIARDEYVSPYLSAYTALSFNWLRTSAYKIPDAVEKKLQSYLQGFLKNDIAPSFYSEGMRSTVRAVALNALAQQGKVGMDDLQRFRPHMQGMSLFGKAHYLQAALHIKEGQDIALETAKMILTHGNQTGGKFIFNEELDDSYRRILSSPLRENCAILSSFMTLTGTEAGRELVDDVPFKMVRTITQTRKGRDHWENTQENMFCMKALADYSRVYENVKPDMTVKASLNDVAFGEAAFKDLRDDAVTLTRPMQAADAGQKATVMIERKGDGRLYHATRLQYAPKSDFSKPVNAGIEINREYSVERDGKWVLLKEKDTMKRGEVVRVDLYVSAPAARNFVVVNDPLPGGLETVNRDLATASGVDADKGAFKAAGGSWFFKFSDWKGYNVSRWSFYHQEMRHDQVRFYADYLPPGNYHLSYTAQAIAEGQFTRMPVLVEEMYDPDVYGKGVMGELNVETAATP